MKTNLTFSGQNDAIAFLNVIGKNGISKFRNLAMKMTNHGFTTITINTMIADENTMNEIVKDIIAYAWLATNEGEYVHLAKTLTINNIDFTKMLDAANPHTRK